MGRPFAIVDVFTDRPLAGNQLAVVLEAEDLDDASMQAIALEFGFSETTFLQPATVPGCDLRVRIFTPSRELPMAGHPVVGTASLLRERGMASGDLVLELGVGPTAVAFDAEGRAWMTQPEARFGDPVPAGAPLAGALGLAVEDLDGTLPTQAVSCGNEFLLVPLRSEAALARARPDPGRWQPVAAASEHAAAYLFTLPETGRARARMFILSDPGLAEDAATGSAAGPLGAYAARHLGQSALIVDQGVEMGRPSRIHVDASSARPRVGGTAVTVARGELAT
ncbi:MAG TPA: PhzF family phenazine biosynthesis protein [Candidatus Dormibacteraeota bacterium]|jgi:trans-2,3-dihydro-3-hydroxyanthranilate isomerase|nr:PhzF family phenazine biosynthesis protein [Candidatus Dormibacteraeota bacterium]